MFLYTFCMQKNEKERVTQILKTFNCLWLFWSRDQEHLLTNSGYKCRFTRCHESRVSEPQEQVASQEGTRGEPRRPQHGTVPSSRWAPSYSTQVGSWFPTCPSNMLWSWGRAPLGTGLREGSWPMGSGCMGGSTWWAERLRPMSVLRVLAQSHLTLSWSPVETSPTPARRAARGATSGCSAVSKASSIKAVGPSSSKRARAFQKSGLISPVFVPLERQRTFITEHTVNKIFFTQLNTWATRNSFPLDNSSQVSYMAILYAQCLWHCLLQLAVQFLTVVPKFCTFPFMLLVTLDKVD